MCVDLQAWAAGACHCYHFIWILSTEERSLGTWSGTSRASSHSLSALPTGMGVLRFLRSQRSSLLSPHSQAQPVAGGRVSGGSCSNLSQHSRASPRCPAQAGRFHPWPALSTSPDTLLLELLSETPSRGAERAGKLGLLRGRGPAPRGLEREIWPFRTCLVLVLVLCSCLVFYFSFCPSNSSRKPPLVAPAISAFLFNEYQL